MTTFSLRAEAPTFVPQAIAQPIPTDDGPSSRPSRKNSHGRRGPTSKQQQQQQPSDKSLRQHSNKHKRGRKKKANQETPDTDQPRTNHHNPNSKPSGGTTTSQRRRRNHRPSRNNHDREGCRPHDLYPREDNFQVHGERNANYYCYNEDNDQTASLASGEETFAISTNTIRPLPPIKLSGAWADTTTLRNDLANPHAKDAVPLDCHTKTTTFSSLASKGNLTVLKRKSNNHRSNSKLDHDSQTLTKDTKLVIEETPPTTDFTTMHKQRQWKLEKFRNRLWDLLENQNLVSYDANQEDANTGEDDTEDSEDGLVEDLPPVPVQRPCAPDPVLEDCYANTTYPLHKAIRRGDERAVRALLAKGHTITTMTTEDDSSHMDPFQLAVHLDNGRILRLLVAAVNTRTISEDNHNILSSTTTTTTRRWPPAPCMAALGGQAECLSVFLDSSTSNLLAKDAKGNTVLHLLCRKKIRTSLLSSCFEHLKADASTSFISRLLCQKNEHGQTCLHIAAANGRADLIDLFLGFASLSLLSKVLFMQDDKGQTPLLAAVASASTDATMSLLMWSGNNSLAIQKVEAKTPSPMLWATRSLHVDMVVLLLDFFNCTESKAELDETLRVAVELEPTERRRGAKYEIIQHLIASGANPCVEDEKTRLCAFEIASNRHDRESLEVLLDSFGSFLKRLRSSRRRDPVLQKQPEAYFEGLESREMGSFREAMRHSLVNTLSQCWKQQDEKMRSLFEDCATLLFENGASLGSIGLDMLRVAIDGSSACSINGSSPALFYSSPRDQPPCRLVVGAPRERLAGPYSCDSTDEALLWSAVAMKCSWVSEKEREHFELVSGVVMDPTIEFDVLLESSDGQTFEANSELLSSKSSKLAAAFRFSRMQNVEEKSSLKVSVPVEGGLCRLLLQHMYHGSLVAGLPEDPVSCCDVLLDLAVLAEHLLCESLLQECETRLLAFNPRDCRCAFCSVPKQLRNGQLWHVNSGPSKCVTTDTAVDILAAADNLEESFFDASHRILVPLRNSGRSPRFFEFRPFQQLRYVVALTCLSSGLNPVFESKSFHAQVELCSGDVNMFKRFFLRCCMEEFASLLKMLPVHNSSRDCDSSPAKMLVSPNC